MKTNWRALVAFAMLVLVSLACAQTPQPDGAQPAISIPADLVPEKAQVWHQPVNEDEREVNANIAATAGEGDCVWTKNKGKALLKWPDIWLRLYDDNAKLRVEDVTPEGTHLFLAMGTALCGFNSETGGRVTIRAEEKVEITFLGTMVMISYHPQSQVSFVRVFDGEVSVASLTGDEEIVTATAGEWVLVEPNEPPRISDQLEEMRELARQLGSWDVFHEVELDVKDGFGVDGENQVAPDKVTIVFAEVGEPTATPTPVSTPTPLCEVVAGELNIRTGPGTNYPLARASLPRGTLLDPLKRISDGSWLLVRVQGTGDIGWVSGRQQYTSCNFAVDALPIATPQPTSTPLPTRTWTPTPVPSIVCPPENTTVELGTCSTLRWDIDHVQAVYFEGNGVAGHDSREVCPEQSQTYTLRIETTLRDYYCRMSVGVRDTTPPMIGQVVSNPLSGLSSGRNPPICNGDKIELNVQIVDRSGISKAQLWVSAGDEWSGPYDMSEGEKQAFSYPIRAGNRFKIYAEDVFGNGAETEERSTDCQAVETLFDFVFAGNRAEWVGYFDDTRFNLQWPGGDTDYSGIARWMDYPRLENGGISPRVLETHPPWEDNGAIWGQFDTAHIVIQENDHFLATVGFLEGAEAGNVVFSVWFWNYDADSSFTQVAELMDTYDGQLKEIDVDLSPFAGQSGIFRLQVDANGASTQDWAVWNDARIERR